jgi:hypothetical protein
VEVLKERVREHLEVAKAYVAFNGELEYTWPSERIHSLARAKAIQAFAKSNGWSATIVDPGIRVIFRKVAD